MHVCTCGAGKTMYRMPDSLLPHQKGIRGLIKYCSYNSQPVSSSQTLSLPEEKIAGHLLVFSFRRKCSSSRSINSTDAFKTKFQYATSVRHLLWIFLGRSATDSSTVCCHIYFFAVG